MSKTDMGIMNKEEMTELAITGYGGHYPDPIKLAMMEIFEEVIRCHEHLSAEVLLDSVKNKQSWTQGDYNQGKYCYTKTHIDFFANHQDAVWELLRDLSEKERGNTHELMLFINENIFHDYENCGGCNGRDDFEAGMGGFFIDVVCEMFAHALREREECDTIEETLTKRNDAAGNSAEK